VKQAPIPVRNPRSGEYDYTFTPPTPQELRERCTALRTAQHLWNAEGVERRISALRRWKNLVQPGGSYYAEVLQAIIHDTGRKHESVLEVNLLASSIERWCGIAQEFFAQTEIKPSSVPFIQIHQHVQPFSLVGVISPWNFPLLLSIIDAIPALLAGCAVVVKPSEITPRFIEPLMHSVREVPELAAVLEYVAGAGETGAELLNNADVVCFTGSVATGRKVYHAAAERFIPVFLELGGKDAALVFEGADLDHATSALLWGSVVNAGQSCLSVERIYVEHSIFEPFTTLLTRKAEALRLAYPTPESGEIGPIISERQTAIINDHLSDAFAKGAVLRTGSTACEQHGGGWWCRPTVLTNVNHSMKIMTEETFGPILPVMSFASREEALALANGTMFGLSGAVFAATWQEAETIARQMQCGAVSVNDAALTAIIHEGEKQSFKFSGIGGTRMGTAAIKRFMRQQALLVKTQHVTSPWWFSSQ
jgi:acyl-CoA reductase-like NAD-dependent aldehyde dehydrogenase